MGNGHARCELRMPMENISIIYLRSNNFICLYIIINCYEPEARDVFISDDRNFLSEVNIIFDVSAGRHTYS